jgi:ArsR family transcriptional regulator
MNSKFQFAAEQPLAQYVRALGHPARLVILKRLAHREYISGQIVEIPPLSQATVARHLLEMKKAGWIKGQILGKKSHYGIHWENVKEMEAEIRKFLDMLRNMRTEDTGPLQGV